MAETEIKKINGKTIADVTARAAAEKLGKAKAGLPVDVDGNPDHGTDGQYAQSDGAGGLKWGGAPAGAVSSVNGKTGAVSLGAADVGARPATWTPTASEVGALPADTKIPAATSDLTNDAGFITRLVSDLANYYSKSETYTQAEVNALVSAIPKFTISVVDALPTTDISGTTVYLVGGGSDADLYTEYIYVNGAWEILGSQRVDLTGYATEAWVETKLGDYFTAETLTAAIITAALGYTPADAEDVEEISRQIDGIPTYAIDEAKRVASSINKVRTSKSFVLSLRSDWHLWTDSTATEHVNSLKSAKLSDYGLAEIMKIAPIDADIDLGDYSWTNNDFTAEMAITDMVTVRECRSHSNAKRKVRGIGNHDWNYGSGRDRMLTPNEQFAYISSDNDELIRDRDNLMGGYGYIDFPNIEIRLILLNTADVYDEWVPIDGESGQSEWISSKQLKWLAEKALDFSDKDFPSDWGVVFVSHHPINYSSVSYQMIKMLEDYREKKSGTISYTIDSGTYSVSYDFTNTEPAEIICSFNGHNHNCRMAKVSSSDSVDPWLPRFTIPNICATRNNEAATSSESFAEKYGEFDASGNPVYHNKVVDTAKGTSFCVAVIDRTEKMIRVYCYGAGVDREMSYGDVIKTYTITNTLTNAATSNAATTINAGDAYAATITPDDGYYITDITVVMNGNDVTDTVFDGLTINISSVTGDIEITVTAETQTAVYNNLLPTSVDTDGSVYNGKGFKENTYLSSGALLPQTRTGVYTTGYMPLPDVSIDTDIGDVVVYVSNMRGLGTDSNCRIGLYSEDKTTKFVVKNVSRFKTEANYEDSEPIKYVDSDGYVTAMDISLFLRYLTHQSSSGTWAPKWFRLCWTEMTEASIITINEPIE